MGCLQLWCAIGLSHHSHPVKALLEPRASSELNAGQRKLIPFQRCQAAAREQQRPCDLMSWSPGNDNSIIAICAGFWDSKAVEVI